MIICGKVFRHPKGVLWKSKELFCCKANYIVDKIKSLSRLGETTVEQGT